MPRYFFDVREGSRFIPDEDGLEFDDLDHAEREAAVAAAEIGRDRLPVSDARDIAIEVRDQHRQMVLGVMVSMRVMRFGPSADADAE